jgi:hypothetical protein
MGEHSQRLDSWIEIAAYLDRDVRTAMRWAKIHGLPVRRVAGGKGRSVFAFTDEIDAWLVGHPTLDSAPPTRSESETPSDTGASQSLLRPRLTIAAVAGALLISALVALPSLGGAPKLDPSTLKASVRNGVVTLADKSGAFTTIHRFDPAVTTHLTSDVAPARVTDLNEDGRPDVLVGVTYDVAPQEHTRNGYLLNLSTSGELRWKFVLGGSLKFARERFDQPWTITDWQVSPGPGARKIAVGTHHWMWWPSTLLVLDHSGRLLSRFVNPGWMESVQWLDADRVAVAGFSNAHDQAMMTVLDSGQADGQAPGVEGIAFECVECGGGRPLLYATFPRSEVNRVSGARFNRASLSAGGGRLIVTTSEEEPREGIAAVYEFDPEFRLVRSSFSDRYWDSHRRLELEKKILHGRDQCPDRNGPRGVQLWTERTGWRTAEPPR